MTSITNKWNKHSTEQEFKALFAHYYAPLCGYTEKLLKCSDSSEEVVQELFIKLWEKRKQQDITQLKAYLYRSAYRSALHHIQHQKVKDKYVHSEKHKRDTYPTPEDGMVMDEMYAAYQDELDQMADKTKHIFLLSRNEDKSYKAIADKMNISIKTVEAHISKALKSFRNRFETINKA